MHHPRWQSCVEDCAGVRVRRMKVIQGVKLNIHVGLRPTGVGVRDWRVGGRDDLVQTQ